MKVNEQTIAEAARRLREADNQQLTPHPWRHRRRRTPGWLIAVPAAALAGFAVGLSLRKADPGTAPLVAKTDTVYIAQPAPERPDTVTPTADSPAPRPVQRAAARPRRAQPPQPTAPDTLPTGVPMSEDHINYALLVRN